MSLPSIPETMTREEFEVHMKGANSSVYIEDGGEVVAIVKYDHGFPKVPWLYDYFGECARWGLAGARPEGTGTTALNAPRCAEWTHEPYIRRFSSLDDLSFFIAFVGLEIA